MMSKLLKLIRKNILLVCIIFSIFVGFGIGFVLRIYANDNKSVIQWVTLPGELFIRALQLFIVPVVFVGVVAATSGLSAKSNLKLTSICMGLIMLTHILATLTAVVGSFVLLELTSEKVNETNINFGNRENEQQKTTYDIIADILFNMIPKNIIKTTTDQEITSYIKVNGTFKRKVVYIEGSNVLGLLVFALLLGLGHYSSFSKDLRIYFLFYFRKFIN